jgi:hypothetical protein
VNGPILFGTVVPPVTKKQSRLFAADSVENIGITDRRVWFVEKKQFSNTDDPEGVNSMHAHPIVRPNRVVACEEGRWLMSRQS